MAELAGQNPAAKAVCDNMRVSIKGMANDRRVPPPGLLHIPDRIRDLNAICRGDSGFTFFPPVEYIASDRYVIPRRIFSTISYLL